MASYEQLLIARLATLFRPEDQGGELSSAARDLVACMLLHWVRAEPDVELPQEALALIGELVARADPAGAQEPIAAIEAYFAAHPVDLELWAQVQLAAREIAQQVGGAELDDSVARLLGIAGRALLQADVPPPAGSVKADPLGLYRLRKPGR